MGDTFLDTRKILEPPHRESHLLTTWLEQWEELHGPLGADGAGTDIGRDLERFRDTSGRLLLVPLFSDVETTQCEEEDGRRRNTETERRTKRLILPQI